MDDARQERIGKRFKRILGLITCDAPVTDRIKTFYVPVG
jgi:hypothetical protein